MARGRRQSSNKLYQSYLKKWTVYCQQQGIDPIYSTVSQGIGFLQSLLSDISVNRGYSVICIARSALSTILLLDNNLKFGDHHLVKLFIRGVYNMAPPCPRYLTTWDLEIVLKMLASWSPAHKITLRKLTFKVVMLILLVTGHRGQTILASSEELNALSPEDTYPSRWVW